MAAWVKQDFKQVQKYGTKKASWYCEWDEPSGKRRSKSCGPGQTGKRNAERMKDQINAEILTGTYDRDKNEKTAWEKFRKEYEARILPDMKDNSANQVRYSLDRLEELCNPKVVSAIDTKLIDKFITKRRKHRGRKPESKVSPATINRDLGNIRAVLNVAQEWGYLQIVPKIRMVKKPKKLPNYVTAEHFSAIYNHCHVATSPAGLPYDSADWWRGLVAMAMMTGWRIGEILSLKRADVDLDEGTAITRHQDNKGNRTEAIALHPVVVDHLRILQGFDPLMFPWTKSSRQLYEEFAKIQDAAGIWLPCPDEGDPNHGECTDSCHRYGFHDNRRAFATLNAENMTREALQALMRHKDASTTDLYINFAKQVKPAVENLHVPDVLRNGTA